MIGNIKNKVLSYFSGLTFKEDSHTYYYNNKQLPSVSALVHNYVEEVDWIAIAKKIAKRDNKTVEEVMLPWEEKTRLACERGHEIHSYAEQLYRVKEKRPEDKAVKRFWNELPDRYVLIDKEVRMVHKKFMYCGTSDLLLWDTYTGMIIVVDYKTNEDLFKCFRGRRLKEPFLFLEDCPFNHYQIQLSLYQILIEQIMLEVSERWLVYFKEEEYKIYKLEDLTKELKESFNGNNR